MEAPLYLVFWNSTDAYRWLRLRAETVTQNLKLLLPASSVPDSYVDAIFSILPLFQRNKRGLCDYLAVCMSPL
jgi:hypothetical protein